MNQATLKHFLDIAIEAAKAGGAVLEKYWGKLSKVEHKTFSWDLVTEADKESESNILKIIQKEFPDHTILAEESGLQEIEKSEYVWMIDPLDGTTNYTHQYPIVSVSIGLMYKEKPIVGVVYNPIQHELFTAALGQGATLNGNKIHVSKIDTLKYSLLATGFAYDRKDTSDNNYLEFFHMTHKTQGVRRGGSAALDLAYVAAGRLDGFWERGLQPWDVAAGVVLIHEAGGKVSSYENTPFMIDSGRILATNGVIHQTISQELQNAPKCNYF